MAQPLDLKLSAPYQKRILARLPKLKNALEVELIAFRFGTPEHGRFFHMQRVANFLFTREHNPDILSPLDWNPWTTKICRTLCDGHESLSFRGFPSYIGLTGPASSSKTYSVSLYVFLLWLSSPMRTKAVVSSTSIQSAKNRIWADVLSLANNLPGALRAMLSITQSNPAMIKLPQGTPKQSIELIAGDDSQREASDKVLGIKSDWFILGVDEATEVSHALYEARNNLDKNPRLQMIFIGNAKDHDDPHGKMCEPKNGWDSISVDDEVWETTLPRGVALHLDGLKSPNLLVGVDDPPPYPRLFNWKNLGEEEEKAGGRNTAGFMRFGRGFWAKGGSLSQIYSIQDFELNGATEKPIWLEPPIRLCGFDPAFTNEGDKPMAVFGDMGLTPERLPVIAPVAAETVDVDDPKSKRRSYAMAERLGELCAKYGVPAGNVGVDSTGTGISMPEIIDEVMKGSCMRIPFNGEVSSLFYPGTGGTPTPANEMFDRRVSELWFVCRLYLHKGQVRGMFKSLMTSMCTRRYSHARQKLISVESKRDMKKRGEVSPDEADAWMILLAVAREKFGFEVYSGPKRAQELRGPNWLYQSKGKTFKELAQQHQPGAKLLIDQPKGGWIRTMIKR